MELGWFEDKPHIRRRDRELAKSMRESIEKDENKRRRHSEAIAVALLLLME